MADTMPSTSNNDDSFDIAQQLLDFNPNGDYANIDKWIESLALIRQKLIKCCYGLADQLEAVETKHAEDMKNSQQQYDAKLKEINDLADKHLAQYREVSNENESLKDSYQRFTAFLSSIRDGIQDFIAKVNDEQQEEDAATMINDDDEDNEGDDYGKGNCGGNENDNENGDDDNESQHDVQEQTMQLNDENNAAATEQHDAHQGQNDDEQMLTDDEDDNVESGDKENVQPQGATSSSTLTLHIVPDHHNITNISNTNQPKKCFYCVDTFVQESAFADHLENFHGFTLLIENGEDTSGKYVRNPSKKRKRLIANNEIAGKHVKRNKMKKVLKAVN